MNKRQIIVLLCSTLFTSSAFAGDNGGKQTTPAAKESPAHHVTSTKNKQPDKAPPTSEASDKQAASTQPMTLIGDMPQPPKLNPESSVSFTDKTAKEVSVNPATGMLSINIPLISIPQNDGLPLNVTLHYRTDGNPAGNTISLDNGWDIFSGLMPSIGKDSPFWGHICNYPVFLLPDGSSHMFYPDATGCTPTVSQTLHYSKDHWKGMLQTYNVANINDFPFFKGSVTSPEGVTYTVDHNIQKITSTHGSTVITYTYQQVYSQNPHAYIPTTVSSNHGVTVTFAHVGSDTDVNNPYRITSMTLGKSVWSFGYDNAHRLSSITRPGGGVWRMEYNSKNHLTDIQMPSGVRYSFTYTPGVNNHIYAKTVVTSISKYSPRIPGSTIKYAYILPPVTNAAGIYQENYETDIIYPDKRKNLVFETGLVKTGTYYVPAWNKSLPAEAILRDTQGNVCQMTVNNWGKRSLTDSGGMTDAPELLTQTINRGIHLTPQDRTVEEKADFGGTTATYTSKTLGTITDVLVIADLFHHHHSNDHHFIVNGHNLNPTSVTDPDHWYDYHYEYHLANQKIASPGYKIVTNGVLPGNMHIILTLQKAV